MKNLLLTKVRLSWYFWILFGLYFIALNFLPRVTFESPVLTLFSVNSFLYGFYISPVLGAQKARIEELHRIVRAESNALFGIALFTKKLDADSKTEVRKLLNDYLHAYSTQNVAWTEKIYEALIGYCAEYSGKEEDKMTNLLEKLVANQQNRTNLHMQLNNKVYSNEWMIMTVLFSITLLFILLIDTGGSVGVQVITALLCTGLSMLMLSLLKLSALAHKKARQMWEPFKTLRSTHYYRID